MRRERCGGGNRTGIDAIDDEVFQFAHVRQVELLQQRRVRNRLRKRRNVSVRKARKARTERALLSFERVTSVSCRILVSCCGVKAGRPAAAARALHLPLGKRVVRGDSRRQPGSVGRSTAQTFAQ
jgi:hypothetical protein